MKFNLTQRTVVSLSPNQCLDFMEKQINHNALFDFHIPLRFGRYRFHRKQKNRFSLTPQYLQSGFIIEGHIEPQANHVVVHYKMMPQLWCYIAITILPLLIFLQIPNGFMTLVASFWFLSSSLITIHVARSTMKLFKELDKIFKSAKDSK